MGLLDALEALGELLDDDEEFDPSFVFVNETGLEIHEIYVSESDNNEWEEDILGEEILEDGQELNVNFSTESRKRYWDIRTIDEDGDEEIYKHFDLSRVTKVIVFYNEDGEAEAEYEYCDCD